MKSQIFRSALLLGTISTAAVACAANAQVAPQEADTAEARPASDSDIVVTARRREESLQTVPVAVVAFGKDAIVSR